jgi:HAD superfamily hydrolase (TIGR01549 family)
VTDRPYDLVLLDAFGTLITVDTPGARLQRALSEELGVDVTLADAESAFIQEAEYYSDHCHLGRDEASLTLLHAECAAVVLEALGIDADPAEAAALLGHTIQYRAYPDAVPLMEALVRSGIAHGVVSNFDYTLGDVLASAGLRFEHLFISAALGVSKPDPEIFRLALSAMGAAAERTLYVGDTPGTDALGAGAAGIDVRIVDRTGAFAAERGDTIESLTDVLELLA